MVYAIPMMLIGTIAVGAEHTPQLNEQNKNAVAKAPAHLSVESKHSIEDLSAMATTPTTPLELIRNCKFAFENNLLLQDDFYTDETIKHFFGGNSVSWWPDTQDKVAFVNGFGMIVKPVMINGADIAIQFKVAKTIDTNNGNKQGILSIGFSESNRDLLFDRVESVLGKSWTLIIDRFPPSHGAIIQTPTHSHGNDKIKYIFDDKKINRQVRMEFKADGTLSTAEFIEEELK